MKSLNYNRSNKENILIPCSNNDGYYIVSLSKSNIKKQYRIHRLVAQAFLPNPNNYPIINHKDEIKTNNTLENLEWCTVKYNTNYGSGVERMRIKQLNRKDNSKIVGMYSLDNVLLNTFPSTAECDRNGFNHRCSCCLLQK